MHVTGLDRPHHEKRKEPEIEKVVQYVKATSGTKGSSSVASGKQGAPPYSPIGPRDTLGDIYYKSYTEESRGDAPHQPPWRLNALYHAYVVGEANTRAANHQIVREWRTMVREREDWEKYRERILRRVDDFEKSKVAFDEEKAKFEADRKSEEWGREGLVGKLRAAEELLAKEKAVRKKICERDNQCAYVARTKIVELEGKVAELTAKVEDAQAVQATKEQAEGASVQ
ncbi:hypothetical protein Hanom_Chr04g00344741 [Helianthus anomalus]